MITSRRFQTCWRFKSCGKLVSLEIQLLVERASTRLFFFPIFRGTILVNLIGRKFIRKWVIGR